MSYEIIEKLKREIEGYKEKPEWQEVGRVLEVGDGIVKILGLRNARAQEILIIETAKGPRAALALNLEEESIGALVLDDFLSIAVGDTVKRTKEVLSIQVGEELVGRVIDPLGKPLDGLGDIFPVPSNVEGKKGTTPKRNPLEARAPSVLERESVNTPLHTGLKAIDSMIPIGRGQRELIIGDRQTGKTAVALDTILSQLSIVKSHKPVICIYVAIGQKQSKIVKIAETLKKFGAMKYSIIVSASASSPAALWYLAPYAGCAIGEYFRDKGQDALVVYDDLSKHAWAYRQISLLLRRPPGREAYPGDIFYLHSRLLERAAKLSKEKGGGSLTALPIVETQLGDVTAYIPTNIISITDGQIYLESDLFYQGLRPALNVGISVSRVGSAAQTKAMKKVAGRLRLQLAQFRELQAFVQFATDVDEATKKRILQGQKINEVLKQEDLAPISFEKQVCVFYAVLNNYFEKVAVEDIKKTEMGLVEFLEKLHEMDILKPIREAGEFTGPVEEKLKAAIVSFLEK
ncbi:MAG: F0F1 ATP synthase subunit alpha [Candidatus Liptonbacteria bacterium RIFCSPLOWO2_01_FULL_52_25]|uniref:ATP synthase subunit alpha n=1 Tax=Candidatus Liptonbacteria bacterium RIFCSPLOWO2_01_FULL_52_25 TaxID=1798650 RepID=A0A1G2CD05_9BACT|nr:MAG: F0F1 ATP synthase subunit alpha [Candidatus Liptonbacteria bacterium RIFCSPLOWO2_01_FULL_52_25]